VATSEPGATRRPATPGTDQWHRVVIFNEGLAKVAEQYLKKGAKIYIEGQLQTRKWQDQQGQDRYSTEVVLQGFNAQLTMLDRAGGGGADFGSDDSSSNFGSFGGRSAPARQPAMAGAGAGPREDMSDEIPF
jgi:single-strand DNA-binding protein